RQDDRGSSVLLVAGREVYSDGDTASDERHTGTTPWRFHGRSIFFPADISRALQIVSRVSRGSITSSITSLPAATYTSKILRKPSISSAFLAAGSSAASTCLRKAISTTPSAPITLISALGQATIRSGS